MYEWSTNFFGFQKDLRVTSVNEIYTVYIYIYIYIILLFISDLIDNNLEYEYISFSASAYTFLVGL